ncbi:MAG TPA: hypothetical protein VGF24_29765 [Vicinamibacterales bacterium]|jgi:hypothetical protein
MIRLVALLVMIVVAPAIAGTMFRLEIGPPVAAGTNTSLKKDFKKKVVLVVRPLVCDTPGAVQITGTAEGLVNGVRQSVALNLVPVDPAAGIYAVFQEWPDSGQWVLQLNGTCPSPKAAASTLVPMKGNTFIREKTQVLREPATRKQLEAALKELS